MIGRIRREREDTMPTVVNTRQHALTSSNGVKLQPGSNELSKEDVAKLAACVSVTAWKKLGWVTMPDAAQPQGAQPSGQGHYRPDATPGEPAQPAHEAAAPEADESQQRRGTSRRP